MTVKPISPNEIANAKATMVPSVVVEAVNELIVKKFSPGCTRVVILQDEIVDLTVNKIIAQNGMQRSELRSSIRAQLFEDHAFDFESLFEQHGWRIVYDKPAYNESYSANFTFYPKSAAE